MQDPGNIRNIPINHSKNSVLELSTIPEYTEPVYNLDDEKDFEKFIKDIEKSVRNSFEYKQFIGYLRDYMDMNKCAFIANTTRDRDSKIKIEIHHYPFTLYDIVKIVYNKRVFNRESVELEMVAKEVMQIHYELLVGLIPLSKTVHELAHNEWIFIPVDKVLGNWQHFMAVYKDFMEVDTADVIERIIEFSENYDKERNEEILSQNNIYLDYKDEQYKLPDLKQIYSTMKNRIETIKQNYYELPEVTEEEYLKKKAEMNNVKKIDPFIWLD